MLDKLMQHGIGVGGGSNIKSVQKIYTTFGDVETEKYQNISTIDISKSIVLVQSTGTHDIRYHAVKAVIVNANSVKLNRHSAYGIVDIELTIIELKSVKSLQRGEFTKTGAYPSSPNSYYGVESKAITPIDASKSMVVYSYLGMATNPHMYVTVENNNIKFKTRLTNSSDTYTVGYEIIEFN